MRRLPGLVLSLLLASGPAWAVSARTPTRPKSHGNSVVGVVVRVDVVARTFSVRSNAGVETTLVRTAATRVQGDTLRPGERVAVRWLEKDGKKIATSVRIESTALAAVTPTAPAGTR